MGLLATQEAFSNGGWWHDSRILAATGQGLEKEEPRAWEGWWNEKVVELARLTMKQPDALCVLLTGRSEKAFADLIKRMLAAKGLEFDIVGLKPQASPTNQRFQSTMHFKQLFLTALMDTYSQAAEIRVYEDRPRHTAGFRRFLAEYNRRQSTASPARGPLAAQVIQVADMSTTLDPVTEVAEIQLMINLHNEAVTRQPAHPRPNKLQIKKTVSYTGYMINTEDSKRLFRLAHIPPDVARHGLTAQANNILICPRSCPASILDKIGGMGSKLLWRVTSVGCYDDSVWVAAVRPVLSTAVYHTNNPDPVVVLATKRGARPVDVSVMGREIRWRKPPSGEAFVFETTVGEKVMLRIEEEGSEEGEYESLFAKKPAKRKHMGDDDRAGKTTHAPYSGRNESRGYHSGARSGGGPRGRGHAGRGFRGGSTRGGGGGGRGGGGRGRGSSSHYRSLDDVEPRSQHGGYGSQVIYDDARHHQHRSQAPPTGPKAPHPRGPPPFHGRGGSRGNGRSPAGAQAQHNATDLQSFY
ncbi:hypothetical protein E4U42_001965 [Claviceps africana]|uniref:Swiss Army Knife RNA repair protein HAD domain-containing protein n=1 Tax=Claviceps africana TaxID=83212 RepID=A0A8K0IZL5_9HYPO|nr:hypothetical protein E4U42_001965 [Claviceps africana]